MQQRNQVFTMYNISKYAWDVPIKDKKGTSIVNAFKKIILKVRKPNKTWVDQGSKFYNNTFKFFLKISNIEMCSTYNEGKSVVAGRFIRTLKNKIFKHVTAISKIVYFDVLDDIVDKCNNTVHRTIKMKPIDVTGESYGKYSEDLIKNILNLKLVTMLEFQNIKTFLLKDILQTGQKMFLLLVKLKIRFLELVLLMIWRLKKKLEVSMKKNCKKLVEKNLV